MPFRNRLSPCYHCVGGSPCQSAGLRRPCSWGGENPDQEAPRRAPDRGDGGESFVRGEADFSDGNPTGRAFNLGILTHISHQNYLVHAFRHAILQLLPLRASTRAATFHAAIKGTVSHHQRAAELACRCVSQSHDLAKCLHHAAFLTQRVARTLFQTRAPTRRLQSSWMTAMMVCICLMTGWPVFWPRTETVMRSGLRKIWTTKSKLCCAKRQSKPVVVPLHAPHPYHGIDAAAAPSTWP